MKAKLPNKLSDLLDLAVTDAQKVLRRKKFAEQMGAWYVKRPDGTCTVCLAGAVICNTLGEEPTENDRSYSDGSAEVGPGDHRMGNATAAKLWAVNSMREGSFFEAYGDLGKDSNSLPEKRQEAMVAASDLVQGDFNQSTNGRASWKTYRKAAKILREAGL